MAPSDSEGRAPSSQSSPTWSSTPHGTPSPVSGHPFGLPPAAWPHSPMYPGPAGWQNHPLMPPAPPGGPPPLPPPPGLWPPPHARPPPYCPPGMLPMPYMSPQIGPRYAGMGYAPGPPGLPPPPPPPRSPAIHGPHGPFYNGQTQQHAERVQQEIDILLAAFRKALESVKSRFPAAPAAAAALALCAAVHDVLRHEHGVKNDVDWAILAKVLRRYAEMSPGAKRECGTALRALRDGYLAGASLDEWFSMAVVFPRDTQRRVRLRDLSPVPLTMLADIETAAQRLVEAGEEAITVEEEDPLKPPPGGWVDLGAAPAAQKPPVPDTGRAPLPPALQGFTASREALALAAAALRSLDVSSRLIGDGCGASGLPGLALSGDVDFGVLSVVQPDLEGTVANGDALPTYQLTPQGLLAAVLAAGSTGTAPAAAAHSALHFAQLTLLNMHPTHLGGVPLSDAWILGGVATPDLPSTLAVTDPARLFWADGGSGLRLQAGQSHSLTVALCRLAGRGREGESGLLAQALLFLVAVQRGSPAYAALPNIKGAAYVNVYSDTQKKKNKKRGQLRDGDTPAAAAPAPPAAGTPPVATLGTQAGHPAFRVFAAARRVSIALLEPSQLDATSALKADAKPFIPPRLKALFGSKPTLFYSSVHDRVLEALGADPHAASRSFFDKLGREAPALGGPLDGINPAFLPVLRRYWRLLGVERGAMVGGAGRLDMFSARLRAAVFPAAGGRRFVEADFVVRGSDTETPEEGEGMKSSGAKAWGKGLYRGRALDGLIAGAHALGMIRVPGLPEGRPALTAGDVAHIRPAALDDTEFTAVVAATDADTVFLVLPSEFWALTGTARFIEPASAALGRRPGSGGGAGLPPRSLPSTWFDGLVHVRFSPDLRPLEHMHRALRAAAGMGGVCLAPPAPGDAVRVPSITADALRPSLAEVEAKAGEVEARGLSSAGGVRLNREQRRAVAAALVGAGRAAPLAIHGPPGTGKTITLVALALELLKEYPNARLLCTAPQNYSADLIAHALSTAGVGPNAMFRMHDPRRPPFAAKQDVLPFSDLDDAAGAFRRPRPLEAAERYRVVVATCAAAAFFYDESRPMLPHHLRFTHVLIDEAGQALLPEALLPLALLGPPAPAFDVNDRGWGGVVCGDPRQLGPIVHSHVASGAGLATSLLERLIAAAGEASLNAAGRFPGSLMLVDNYRSHPSLLDLPSKLFYGGKLVAAADPHSVLPPEWSELYEEDTNDDVMGYKDTATLEGAPASLMFYGVRGQAQREGEAPSYHNPLEAAAVADLVQGLLDASSAGVKAGELGVMATYRRQVQSIRILLRKRGLGGVRVGTVDDFQGQEERVIFISTVLSSPASLSLATSSSLSQSAPDAAVSLWNNPKRFNVAITRAKALLVVVGHPAVLIADASWRELVRHCAATGAFRGAGAAALARRLRVGGMFVAPDDEEGSEEGGSEAEGEEEEVELAAAVEQMASLALLGAGDAAMMYPQTLDEMHDAYAEETPWRIML